jgi:hypothetical protein
MHVMRFGDWATGDRHQDFPAIVEAAMQPEGGAGLPGAA